ncbi:beta-1,4-N-acetylgalactosaminyltransferase bre-4-like [Homalodisca vitripennis]|uniref:beta-1,4-N-acetylgalactosaminyltransferase bre-4-like n=1 Tax=Homalodisca vitripennis TaxID=197043 RepID=UPI001EEA2DC5|nr:beta-1,4-N-acetylgalactosaminyltransferase bre-4-like [Homalodisca vitripennis]XP_046668812.1 beta-1,4-N-acetylgalactosaminyltransferase bre-4-like [Homalodisca vitripennis]
MRVVRLRNPHISRRGRGRWWGGGRCLRLLPLLCILLIIAALSILAVSEMSLVQKRQIGPTGAATGGAAARIMPGRVQHPQQPHQQTQGNGMVFKIEPLLRRNAPSVELAAQVAQNAARAAIVARIIVSESVLPAQHSYTCARPLDDCPRVPPSLRGTINVSSSPIRLGERAVETHVGVLGPGGSWRPPDCTPRHTVAVVIPYRDRWEQLLTLLYYLHPLLQRQQLQYRVFVVEQTGNDTFNKGVLMNAGFLTALRMLPEPGVMFHCFVFHDVDMLPEDDRNMYSCPVQPRHMSVAVNELDYKLPYRQLVGGVFAIRTEHFFKVNGYSNLYWGWGGEDDDMGYRVEHVLTTISRPPEEIARYTMIKHEKRKPLAWKVRVKLLRTSWRRYRLDGLNTVQYNLLSTVEHALYTRLLVDVGHPPQNIRVLQQQQDNDDRRTTVAPAS